MKNHGMSEPVIDDPDPLALPTRARATVAILAWLALCLAGWLLVGAAAYGIWCAYRIIAG